MAGINLRGRLTLQTLERAVDKAREEQCERFLVLGDLLDGTRPAPQLLAEVIRILRKHETEMLAGVCLGNHEAVSTQPGDHALAPLGEAGILVYERPAMINFGNITALCVPYQPGSPVEWLPREIERSKEWAEYLRSPKILLTHVGITDSSMPSFLRSSGVSVETVRDLMEKHGIQATFAGDYHNRRAWFRGVEVQDITVNRISSEYGLILQVGTLSPTGFDNPGNEGYGTLAILDTGDMSLTITEIPGPRFVTARNTDSLREVYKLRGEGHEVFLRMVVVPEHHADGLETLEKLKSDGVIVDGEVQLDTTAQKQAAAEASQAASSSTSIDKSLAEYVERMLLQSQGVDRESILRKVKGYLK